MNAGSLKNWACQKRVEPVKGCRQITKKDMIHNDATPAIEVDPETYEVKVDGVACDMRAVPKYCRWRSAIFLF